MEFRKLRIDEVDRIKEIDATNYIKNAWREVVGTLTLVEIDWTDYELPNGLEWHMHRYTDTINNGGCVFGCFDNDKLVAYAAIDSELFGTYKQYVLLDQLFVSKNYRNKQIGTTLVSQCTSQAKSFGAKSLFVCAGSSENTIAFYRHIGFINAKEINKELYNEDPRDIQMELVL